MKISNLFKPKPMTPEKLFRKYRGRKASRKNENGQIPSLGIVVGFCEGYEYPLIIRITNNGYGWGHIGPSDFIIDGDENNSRYRYVNIRHIQIKFGH